MAGKWGAQRPGVSVIEIPSDLSSFVDIGTGFTFVYTENEVRRTFQRARKELLGYRDNLAVVDINRILLSNAAPAVKERARMLKSFVAAPTFDTVKDAWPYAAVSRSRPSMTGPLSCGLEKRQTSRSRRPRCRSTCLWGMTRRNSWKESCR